MVKKIDVSIGQFSVSVLFRGVLDDFEWVYTSLCGRSCPGYVLGGTQLGFYLVILTLLDTHVRGLVVSLLAQPCLHSQTLLRVIIQWIYHWMGLLSPSLEMLSHKLCPVLTGL